MSICSHAAKCVKLGITFVSSFFLSLSPYYSCFPFCKLVCWANFAHNLLDLKLFSMLIKNIYFIPLQLWIIASLHRISHLKKIECFVATKRIYFIEILYASLRMRMKKKTASSLNENISREKSLICALKQYENSIYFSRCKQYCQPNYFSKLHSGIEKKHKF